MTDALTFCRERLAEMRKLCAEIADNALRACITDDERGIATLIRNLILAPSITGVAPDFTDGKESHVWLKERWDKR